MKVRRWGTVFVLLTTFITGTGVAGCSPGSGRDEAGARDETVVTPELDYSYKAEIDESTGAVRLPITAALGLLGEGTDIDSEGSPPYIARCLTEAGYPHTYDPDRVQPTQEWYHFGPWVEENVAIWGYVGPPGGGGDGVRTFDAVQPVNARSEAEGWQEQRAECAGEFINEVGLVSKVLEKLPAEVTQSHSLEFAHSSDTYHKVQTEWRECVEGRGLELVDEYTGAGWIKGVDVNELSEENIRVALIDVQCRTQVDFMQRILDEAAALEGPIVEKYEAEIAEAAREIADIAERKRELAASAQ
ncbi:hypothetical protein [Jonesia quinghaiensis]|uniref:hypothetical protein n=1 Tax=Jonesia quinghaiensis TaxID=262806 RepID=UPI000423DAB2|nr:hypothetical protein [Jonesia quinghaiensis]